MVTQPKACTRAYNTEIPPPLSEVRLKARADKQEIYADFRFFRWGNHATNDTDTVACSFSSIKLRKAPLTFLEHLLYFRGSRHATDIARPSSLGPTQQMTCERAGWAFPFITPPVTVGDNPNRSIAAFAFRSPLWEFASSYERDWDPRRATSFMKTYIFKYQRRKDPDLEKLFSKGRWTRIKNNVLDAIISKDFGISKNEMQILFAIIRKTWGYGKSTDRISRTQIQRLTGLDLAVISHSLKALRERRILVKENEHSWKTRQAIGWRIEDNTDKWLTKASIDDDSSSVRIRPLKQGRIPPHRAVENRPTTKDSLTKEHIKYPKTREEEEFLKNLQHDDVKYAV